MRRGEGIIQAGKKEVRVLFNIRALAEAEGQMKKSVIGVLQTWQANSEISITEMAHILRAGMTSARRDNGKGQPATLIEAYHVIGAAGLPATTETVVAAVGAVLGYDPRKDGSGDGDSDEQDEDAPNE